MVKEFSTTSQRGGIYGAIKFIITVNQGNLVKNGRSSGTKTFNQDVKYSIGSKVKYVTTPGGVRMTFFLSKIESSGGTSFTSYTPDAAPSWSTATGVGTTVTSTGTSSGTAVTATWVNVLDDDIGAYFRILGAPYDHGDDYEEVETMKLNLPATANTNCATIIPIKVARTMYRIEIYAHSYFELVGLSVEVQGESALPVTTKRNESEFALNNVSVTATTEEASPE